MNNLRTALAALVLSGFLSVPPCGGTGAAPSELEINVVCQISFTTEIGKTYTVEMSHSPGGPWVVHPWCDNFTASTVEVKRMWTDPEESMCFFRLIVDGVVPPPPDPPPPNPPSTEQPPIPGGE